MLRTLNKDNTDSEYQIFGAQSKNSNADCASLVLGNFDQDDNTNYRMAELAVRDNYGSSNLNGYGNLHIRTMGGDGILTRMLVNHGGNVGIGTMNPIVKLDVSGGINMQTIHLDANPGQPMDTLIGLKTLVPTILDAAVDTSTVAGVFADAAPAVRDSNISAWRFINNTANRKINWYMFYNASNSNVQYRFKNLRSAYVKLRFNNTSNITVNNLPYLTLYDHTMNDGNDGAAWYRHRVNYIDYSNLHPLSNIQLQKDYIFYVGDHPVKSGFLNVGHDNFISMPFNNSIFASYTGPAADSNVGFQPTNIMKFIVLNTSSSSTLNAVDFSVLEWGSRFGKDINRVVTYFSDI